MKLTKPQSTKSSAPIAQFKAVGTDENGKTLYQKVEPVGSAVEIDPSSQPSVHKFAFKTSANREMQPSHKEFENMTPELRKLKHDRSNEECPELNDLHDEEFVITKIVRHPLAGLVILATDLVVIIAMVSVWLIFLSNKQAFLPNTGPTTDLTGIVTLAVFSLVLISIVFGWVAYKVYNANKIFVTSERLIQFVAQGLFDRKEQSIDLTGIEDVAYHQKGLLATFFDFGTIRMSTLGDESTYTLTYVEDPNTVVKNVLEIIQAVKNDRPIPAQFDN